MEVPCEILHRMEIATSGALRIVATLEFIQHQLPKMGDGKPPVTRGLQTNNTRRRPMQQRPPRQRLSSNAPVSRSISGLTRNRRVTRRGQISNGKAVSIYR